MEVIYLLRSVLSR